jgi:hypothetical protein
MGGRTAAQRTPLRVERQGPSCVRSNSQRFNNSISNNDKKIFRLPYGALRDGRADRGEDLLEAQDELGEDRGVALDLLDVVA